VNFGEGGRHFGLRGTYTILNAPLRKEGTIAEGKKERSCREGENSAPRSISLKNTWQLSAKLKRTNLVRESLLLDGLEGGQEKDKLDATTIIPQGLQWEEQQTKKNKRPSPAGEGE